MRQALVICFVFAVACAPGYRDVCGDGLCVAGAGENCGSCASDCGSCLACGDGTCSAGAGETCTTCRSDCGACPTCGVGLVCPDVCGDFVCDPSETCSSCEVDCGSCVVCGDAHCRGTEDCANCPGDCGGCPGSCGAATCAGCCMDNICTGGGAASECGSGGNRCMACGSGHLCSSGACVVDPASRWNVVLDSLTVPSTNYAGAAWDVFGGAPDPYVEVRVLTDTAIPSAQNGPDDVFMISYPGTPVVTNVRASDLTTQLRFDVYDEDATDYEFIGAYRFPTPASAFGGSVQTTIAPIDAATRNSGFTLRWHLVPF